MVEESERPHREPKIQSCKPNNKTAGDRNRNKERHYYGVQKVTPVIPDISSRTEQTMQLMVRQRVKVPLERLGRQALARNSKLNSWLAARCNIT